MTGWGCYGSRQDSIHKKPKRLVNQLFKFALPSKQKTTVFIQHPTPPIRRRGRTELSDSSPQQLRHNHLAHTLPTSFTLLYAHDNDTHTKIAKPFISV